MQQDVARQRDAEIGFAIAIHVARNDGVAAAGKLIVQLTSMMREATQSVITGEVKGVVASELAVGVDIEQVDLISAPV